MIEKNLIKFLKKNINFYSGVPDSLLSGISKKLKGKKIKHFIAANEGSAISHGIGYFLAKKKIPCIYFQNSGLGNAINPIISIAHKKVYSIPLFLVIGWRGSPGSNDEPQHMVKGKITLQILKLLGIKYYIIKKNKDKINIQNLKILLNHSKKFNVPVACVIKKNVLIQSEKNKKIKSPKLQRSLFLESLLKKIKNNTRIISTTGFTSRELYRIRINNDLNQGKDFYMIGGMGHSLSVSLTHSVFSKKKTICIDGDGSLLMHLGSTVACGRYSQNFKYILINNFSHESVGGQNTNSEIVNFEILSKSVGFKKYLKINNKKEISKKLNSFLNFKGKVFLEVRVGNGSLVNLGRPKDFINIKKKFISK